MPVYVIVPARKGTTAYRLKRLNPHPDVAQAAYRLTGTDGNSYDVALMEWGWVCDCPDFVDRREEAGTFCKHIFQLADAGLLTLTAACTAAS